MPIDHIRGTVVPVIASFNSKGQIKPLYFEYDGNQIKILKYAKSSHEFLLNGYDCIAEFDGYLRNVRLFYDSQHMWHLEIF